MIHLALSQCTCKLYSSPSSLSLALLRAPSRVSLVVSPRPPTALTLRRPPRSSERLRTRISTHFNVLRSVRTHTSPLSSPTLSNVPHGVAIKVAFARERRRRRAKKRYGTDIGRHPSGDARAIEETRDGASDIRRTRPSRVLRKRNARVFLAVWRRHAGQGVEE